MIHEIPRVGVLQCNCSIFGDEQSGTAVVIDPGDNIEDVLAILEKHSLRVQAIVITHAHIDHIGGAAQLKAATGAPVLMNANDQELYDHLDVQAAWLGVPATCANHRRSSGPRRRCFDVGPGRVSSAPHSRPHPGQHLPVASRSE